MCDIQTGIQLDVLKFSLALFLVSFQVRKVSCVIASLTGKTGSAGFDSTAVTTFSVRFIQRAQKEVVLTPAFAASFL